MQEICNLFPSAFLSVSMSVIGYTAHWCAQMAIHTTPNRHILCFLKELPVAIFAGLLVVFVANQYHFTLCQLGFAGGMAGWGGVRLIGVIEERILGRISGTPSNASNK